MTTTIELPPANLPLSPNFDAPGDQLADSHYKGDTQAVTAVGDQLPPAKAEPSPKDVVSGELNFTSSQYEGDTHEATAAGDQTSSSHYLCDAQGSAAAGINLPDSQTTFEAQRLSAVGDQATSDDHAKRDTQRASVVSGSTFPDSHRDSDTQVRGAVRGPILADPVLGLLADALDDMEMVRVANENRLRTLTADGEHGHGLSAENKQVGMLAAIVEALQEAEHKAILNLQRSMRQHPLGPWVKSQAGVGEKQAARLLSVIQDPYWNDLHNRPRTVSELWAFCGLHVLPGSQSAAAHQIHGAAGSNVHAGSQGMSDAQSSTAAGVAPKRARGQKANWNDDARKRVWLVSASCIKQPAERSKYRAIYDAGRIKYAESIHNVECVRCGPKGKPALVGSPLSLGHQHARAMRLMSKAILKDLWLEAKRIHELPLEEK